MNHTHSLRKNEQGLNIGVFTSASSKLSETYYTSAKNLGRYLGNLQHHVIYGGANVGLMGALADGCREKNGQVTGIFPRNLGFREIAHNGLTNLIYTNDLHERKKIIYEKSDFFISMPGGFGTLDETFEVLTWNQLGHIQKPLYFYNFNNFFGHLLDFIKMLEEEKFIKVYDCVNVTSFTNTEELEQILKFEAKKKYDQ